MIICGMCGWATSHYEMRWYKYDNGEQFKEAVCMNCADLHAKLLKA